MSAYVYGFLIGWMACIYSLMFVVTIRPHVLCDPRHGCRVDSARDRGRGEAT